MVQHIAFIMDGNRRWAKTNQRKLIYGDESKNAVKIAISYCFNNKIPYLSLWALALANLKRSSEEIEFVYQATIDTIEEILPDFLQRDIRVRFVGKLEVLPLNVRNSIAKIQTATQHCRALYVSIFFAYSGQEDIMQATRAIATGVSEGSLKPEIITRELLSQYLWTYPAPDPEIIIRTGYYNRLSDFMLYQAAYSEIFFIDCLWPDLKESDIDTCMQSYQKTAKNFGT